MEISGYTGLKYNFNKNMLLKTWLRLLKQHLARRPSTHMHEQTSASDENETVQSQLY